MGESMIRTYSELMEIDDFEERFAYLSVRSEVGVSTFGFERYLNQRFYTSRAWRQLRNEVIVRDGGCDLAFPGREIYNKVVIHHMNPVKVDDITHGDGSILDPEYLISTSLRTHNAIHYGDERQLQKPFTPRASGDTRLW